MPANPTMPHMSAGPRRSWSGGQRALGALARVAPQHVGSRPEGSKENIEHREGRETSENTCDEECDNCPHNPHDLDRAVIRLDKSAPASHLGQHGPNQT